MTPFSHFAHGYLLTYLQRKRIRRIALPTSDEEDTPDIRPRSPPRLTKRQKGKHREAQSQLPTPTNTQRQQQSLPQHRERPGANAHTRRAAHRLRNTSPVSDRHQDMERRGGRPRTSRQGQQTTEKQWTHIAKMYGMLYSPWVTEQKLDQALRYRAGQDLPEDNICRELVVFFDRYEVTTHERRDPQFQTNVSFPLSNTYPDLSMNSFDLGFGSCGVR